MVRVAHDVRVRRERLQRQIRADGAGAVPDQAGELVDIPRLPCLGDEAGAHTQPAADQFVVHSRHGQQHRDRHPAGINAPVAESDDGRVARCLGRCVKELPQRRGQPTRTRVRGKARRKHPHREWPLGLQPAHVVGQQDRTGQLQQMRMRRRVLQKRRPRSQVHGQGHHGAFPEGIDGWIRDLGEPLLEILVEESRPSREHSRGDVVPHGEDRVFPFLHHRAEDAFHILQRVSEGALVRRRGVTTGTIERHRPEPDEMPADPRPIGQNLGQRRLDLVIPHHGAPCGVHHQHLPRPQPSLLEDALGSDVEHAGLRGHHDQIIFCAHEASGAQAVAIQRRADRNPIRKRQGGRPIPRFGQTGVVFVEPPHRLVEPVLRFPGCGHQHGQDVGEAAAGYRQQLNDVVQHRAVAAALLDHRLQHPQTVAPDGGAEFRVSRLHPVHVAAQRVDLAVVGKKAEWLGEAPARERVGAVPLMEDGQRRLVDGIGEIAIETRQPRRREQCLVDDRAPRARRDVQGEAGLACPPFDPAATQVQGAVEGVAGHRPGLGHHDLRDVRLRRPGVIAQRVQIRWHIAPAYEAQPGLRDDLLHEGHGSFAVAQGGGQKAHPDREVIIGCTDVEVPAQHRVR